MKAYAYKAALYCEPCREKIKAARNAVAWPRVMKEDSDYYPQGPYPAGGGEADCPQHCDACGAFLENPLTDDGREYVRAALERADGDPETLEQWRQFYGAEIDALVTH